MRVITIAILCLFVSLLNAEPVQWEVKDGGNNHFYEVINAEKEISWTEASAEALAKGGYLATVVSIPENDFIFNLIDNLDYWNRDAERNFGPWLGGVFANDHWTWVSNEEFVYSNWYVNEPNNENGKEAYVHYFSGITEEFETSRFWNDQPDLKPGGPVAYVVEYDTLLQ